MSYIENYFKNKDARAEACKNFFNSFTEEESITQSKKEILKLLRQLDEEQDKCTKLLNKRYNAGYEPLDKPAIIHYDGHAGSHYYDASTGLECPEPEAGTSNTYRIDIKNGTIEIVTGYCFELGSVIKRTYKYTITSDNKRMRMSLLKESIMPLISDDRSYSIPNNFSGDKYEISLEKASISERRYWYSHQEKYGLESINATYFLNKMYGLEKEDYGELSLYDVLYYSNLTPGFEVIIRTAPGYLIQRLLKMKLPASGTVAKMIDMSEADYQKGLANNTIVDYLDFRDFLKGNLRDGDLEKTGLDKKTTPEWLDYLEKCKIWQQDLDFYSVNYDTRLAQTLVKAYVSRDYYYHCDDIYKYYKFGKFCKYVIDETINQGYNSIRNFCSELHDYINMCKDLDVKPTLYSSYLHQTHDITSRNHKIKLEQEQEEIFKKRYEDFKPYKTEKYSIIAPEAAKDVQHEGDQMNNCVASYIKRIIDGSCLIVFLRYTADIARSLVTVEIRDNAIVQAKQSHNNRITPEQQSILQEFAAKRKLEVRI